MSFSGVPSVVSDDAGGVIVVMSDYGNLLAQRKSASGQLLWNTLAAPVTVFNGTSISISDMQKDGKGGAYIAFTNAINGNSTDLYLQRLDSNGNKLFGQNGIKVNPANVPLNYDGKLGAGKNGVIVVWANTPGDRWSLNDSIIKNARLYIQRFSTAGEPLWPQSMLVSEAPTGRIAPVVVPDGNDGTYVIFTDFRNLQKTSQGPGNYYTNLDIYMQYFDSLGLRVWGSTDSALTTQPGEQLTYQDGYSDKTVIPDSTGGFEIIFMNDDMCNAQRVNRNGEKIWPLNYNLGDNYRTKYGIQAISDGAGGLVASWLTVPPNDPFIFTQRVTAEGALSWGADPVTVSSPGDVQFGHLEPPAMTLDDEGNYVFSWYNSGDDTTNPNNYLAVTQLKAQKITSAGNKAWKKEGQLICQVLANDKYIGSSRLLASAANKIMAVWRISSGNFPNGRITSAMINPDGNLFDNLVRISETMKDGDWNDPSIWADGKLPLQEATVIIKTNVTVNQHVTCKGLKVVPPGTVTVNTGFTITITN